MTNPYISVAPFLSMKERNMHERVNEIPGTSIKL